MNINLKDQLLIKIAIALAIMLMGIFAAKIYQPEIKSEDIYKQALQSYENKDYQNAYFLFGKIGITSNLKPYALYRQSLCAKLLNDTTSELNAYKKLYKHYPLNSLSTEARYNTGKILYRSAPDVAIKQFEYVSRHSKDKNYKIASKYYIAKYNIEKGLFTESEKEAFREYLKTAPDGRFATDIAQIWFENSPQMTSEDYTLTGRAYYYAKQYSQADYMFSQANLKDSWAIYALNSYELQNYSKSKYLIENGVSQYPDTVSKKDYLNAANIYLKTSTNKISDITYLMNLSKQERKDYLWNMKCRLLQGNAKGSCYEQLYKYYPDSEFSDIALSEIILYKELNGNYDTALTLGEKFKEKFSNSERMPMVIFWMGKSVKNLNNPDYKQYFSNIVNNYPDTYYAYRAFWEQNNIQNSVARYNTLNKAVEFPYSFTSKEISGLKKVNDYEMIIKLADDKFIKSWAQYKLGLYSQAAHEAQKEMKKLYPKPSKNDPRWKLVYPQIYYQNINFYSKQYGNDPNIITALIREESFFNPHAQSSVGAVGLMQLMPETAREILSKNGYNLNEYELSNIDVNLKTGNMYFASLNHQLNNKGISVVASYNGGIGSVLRWQKNLLYRDVDEFVEQIPYEETREYVKKVFRSYWNYIRIYEN